MNAPPASTAKSTAESTAEFPRWTQPGSSRVPFWVYTDAQLYQRELEKIFYGAHWCYVGLEAEIPDTGDYKLNGDLAGMPASNLK